MATEINLKRIYDTIAEIEAHLTDSKIAIATDQNAYGFEPLAWGAGAEIYYAAALGENAQFGNLYATGDIWVTDTVRSYNDDDLKIQFDSAAPAIILGVSGLTRMYWDSEFIRMYENTEIVSATEFNHLTLKYQGPADAHPIDLLFSKTVEPETSDDLGSITFRALNDNAEEIDYAAITTKINSKTNGGERGELYLNSDIVGIGNGQIEITPLSITLNDDTAIMENLGLGMAPDSGWGSKLAMEGQFTAYEKFSISGVGPYTGIIVGNIVMSDDTTFVLTGEQSYGPVMMNMGAGGFSVAIGVAGHEGDHFHLAEVSWPLIITPSSFAITSNQVSIANGTDIAINATSGNVGIGMVPTEKFCIKLAEHEIKIYDAIHTSWAVPANINMAIRFRIGTDEYWMPVFPYLS